MSENDKDKFNLGEIYPQFTAEELIEAEDNLRRYLAVVKGIFGHIVEEKPKTLTELRRRARLRIEKKGFK